MDSARYPEEGRPLEVLRRGLESLRKAAEERGKKAFEDSDPAAAKLEAERLERLERAEQLLNELESVLRDLGPEAGELSNESEGDGGGSGSVTVVRETARLPHRVLHPDRLREPVLAALREAGGRAHVREIWARVERMVSSSLSQSDLEKMKNHNESRWQYNVRWTLTYLKHDGLVEHGDRKGMWRLTRRA